MARPRFRKINPSLDLTGHLLRLDQLPQPFCGEALFGRRAPLEVEVGSGKGLFLRTAAAQHPEVDFLGIEIAWGYARLTAAGLARAGLSNAKVLAADAGVVFREVFADDSLAAVHIYFPDPWWKRRHRKRRLMQESFVRDLQRTLQVGGWLHFWTDVEEYFRTSLELLASQTALEGPVAVPESSGEIGDQGRTHFDRRSRREGQPVFRAQFRKRSAEA